MVWFLLSRPALLAINFKANQLCSLKTNGSQKNASITAPCAHIKRDMIIMKKLAAPLLTLSILLASPAAFSTGFGWGYDQGSGWGNNQGSGWGNNQGSGWNNGWDNNQGSGWGNNQGSGWNNGWGYNQGPGCDDTTTPPPATTSVPEINANGAALSLALLGGIFLVRRERKRNKD